MVLQYPTAARFVRKLRGGSQAHLIQANDKNFYAVKSPGNPQGARVLVNEYLGSKVFQEMGIASAASTPVVVTQEFLNGTPEMDLVSKHERVPIQPGFHLGSRYEASPDTVAIYDFLPEALISQINNTDDFLGALVADQWLNNKDGRQFVFFREQTSSSKRGFRAVAIDHGFCLGGNEWTLRDSPLTGMQFQQTVYRSATSLACERWLTKLNGIDEERMMAWVSEIPSEWLGGEEPALMRLLAQLFKRKERLSRLVETAVTEHPERFPNWYPKESVSLLVCDSIPKQSIDLDLAVPHLDLSFIH